MQTRIYADFAAYSNQAHNSICLPANESIRDSHFQLRSGRVDSTNASAIFPRKPLMHPKMHKMHALFFQSEVVIENSRKTGYLRKITYFSLFCSNLPTSDQLASERFFTFFSSFIPENCPMIIAQIGFGFS